MACKPQPRFQVRANTRRMIMRIRTDRRYWDCDCVKNYIRPASEHRCDICGAEREDCADSMVNELHEMVPGYVEDKDFLD